MNNWYAIETEAEFRRREWEREIEANARAAQARQTKPKRNWRWPHLFHLSLPSPRALGVARLRLASTLEPDCATPVC